MGGIDRYNWEDAGNDPANENSYTALTVGGILFF